MELIINGNNFNTNTDIIPGEFEFDDIKPLSNEDLVKTIELDSNIVSTESSGDNNE